MFWFLDWEFCRKCDCRDDVVMSSLQNRHSAHQWLRQFKNNVQEMLALRSLLSQEGGTRNVSWMSNDAVIDQIAELLAGRRIHVHVPPADKVSIAGLQSQGSGATGAAQFVPFPISERKPRVPPPPSPEPAIDRDPPTFPPKTNFAAQAATLVHAANAGAAACYI